MKILNSKRINCIVIIILEIFLMSGCSRLRYSLEEIKINKNGYCFTIEYSAGYLRKLYLPIEITIYANDNSENFTYFKENIQIDSNKEKRQIKVQTLPLEEPFNTFNYHTNKIYHFIIDMDGGYGLVGKFEINNKNNKKIEKVKFKNDMSEYSVEILFSEFMPPH